jgi:hypothetical protein
MNHPWQQPIRPLEVKPDKSAIWCRVLFIRPRTPRGWEVIVESGNVWTSDDSFMREVQS